MKYAVVAILGLYSIFSELRAEDRVYPIIDAQGRVQVIKSKDAVVSKPELSKDASVPDTESPFKSLDDDVYVDSEYLEKKSFNLQNKKHFYYVPNGTTSQQVIESSDSDIISVPASQIKKPQRRQAFYASSYQMLTKEWLETQVPAVAKLCQNLKKIKKNSRSFKDINALWIGSDDVILKTVDRILSLKEVIKEEKQLRISSFATTNKNPKFYLPIVTFLDSQGCILSGAWQYWSQAYPATESQFSAIEGLLRMPVATQYIVFSRPVAELVTGLPQQNMGSLIVENE